MGPLTGAKVIELAGLGPGPFAGMMLSDMGADVIRVDRADRVRGGDPSRAASDVVGRGRRSIGVDLKDPEGIEVVLDLVAGADVLLEGFRPGVTERLGLGPDVCLERNPKLVYGRMTGWGQDGPYASMAGHDINYISLSGALHAIGPTEGPPVPPLNLVGDYGGGGMLLAFGVACALWETARSGEGQVIDCAMVDGAATLMAAFYGMSATGAWSPERESNVIDGGAPFYDAYETSDGKFISIGSIESQFYDELLTLLGLDDIDRRTQMDRTTWPDVEQRIADTLRTKTRDEWCALLDGTDVCFAPVLDMAEAAEHPHAKARASHVSPGGITQPAPAPRFSRTVQSIQGPPALAGQHTDEILADLGLGPEDIERLRSGGTVA